MESLPIEIRDTIYRKCFGSVFLRGTIKIGFFSPIKIRCECVDSMCDVKVELQMEKVWVQVEELLKTSWDICVRSYNAFKSVILLLKACREYFGYLIFINKDFYRIWNGLSVHRTLSTLCDNYVKLEEEYALSDFGWGFCVPQTLFPHTPFYDAILKWQVSKNLEELEATLIKANIGRMGRSAIDEKSTQKITKIFGEKCKVIVLSGVNTSL